MHHAFLYISLQWLHDYHVKMLNFTFCKGCEHKTTTFFFFSWTLKNVLEKSNPEKNCQHLTSQRWNKRDKVWSNATLVFKWRFRSRRRHCCLSSLLQNKGRRDKHGEEARRKKEKRRIFFFSPTDPILISICQSLFWLAPNLCQFQRPKGLHCNARLIKMQHRWFYLWCLPPFITSLFY